MRETMHTGGESIYETHKQETRKPLFPIRELMQKLRENKGARGIYFALAILLGANEYVSANENQTIDKQEETDFMRESAERVKKNMEDTKLVLEKLVSEKLAFYSETATGDSETETYHFVTGSEYGSDDWKIMYNSKHGNYLKHLNKDLKTNHEQTGYIFDAPPVGSTEPDGVIDAIILIEKSQKDKEIDEKLVKWGFGKRTKKDILDIARKHKLENGQILIREADGNISDISLPNGKTTNAWDMDIQGLGDAYIIGLQHDISNEQRKNIDYRHKAP